jgi:hypothetical protein
MKKNEKIKKESERRRDLVMISSLNDLAMKYLLCIVGIKELYPIRSRTSTYLLEEALTNP